MQEGFGIRGEGKSQGCGTNKSSFDHFNHFRTFTRQ